MTVPNRTGSAPAYRYGFQGQEKDDEIKGGGNSLNYTFRMHDPRVGRFFATDPLTKEYPFYSPFAFSANLVISSRELEGLEPLDVICSNGKLSNAMIGLLHSAFLFDKIRLQNTTWISSKSPDLSISQKMHYYNTKMPTATCFYSSVIFADSEKLKSVKKWIPLVAHEQSHQQDIKQQGAIMFYLNYGADGSHLDYKDIPTEERAFQIEFEYMPLLLQYKNGIVLDLFNQMARICK